MKLTLFFCDQAQSRADGKLDISGVFNELHAPGFPARQDHLTLAGVIEWDWADKGRQPFTIEIVDPQHSAIFTINGHSDVEGRSPPRPPARTHLALPLTNLVFHESGEYKTMIAIKGESFLGPSLYVVETESAA